MDYDNKWAFCLGVKYKKYIDLNNLLEKKKIEQHLLAKPLAVIPNLFFEQAKNGILNFADANNKILLSLPNDKKLEYKDKLKMN